MSIRKNLIISTFFLLGLVLLYFFTTPKVIKNNEQLENKIKISSITDVESVSRIRVTGSLGTYDLNKSKNLRLNSPILARSDWVLREPLFAPVKSDQINLLLDKIIKLLGETVDVSSINNQDLSKYGLLPPSAIVIIDHSQNKEVLSFGFPNEVTKQFFLQKEGDPKLYLMPTELFTEFQNILNNLRSFEVIKFKTDQVQAIDLVQGESFFRLFKKPCESKSKWTLNSDGLEVEGDKAFIEKEIKELSEIRVNKIYDNPMDILQFTGLAAPTLIFKINFDEFNENSECKLNASSNKNELLIQIGKGISLTNNNNESLKSMSSYYLKIGGENVIYEIDKGTFGDWMQGIDHFRSKNPFINLNYENKIKVEVVAPEIKCAALFDFNKEDKSELLLSSLRNLKLDTIVSMENLSSYEKISGLKVSITSDTKCLDGFEQVGVINQLKEDDTTKEQVASILKITKCGEPGMYGVLSNTNFKEVQKNINKFCQSR